MSSSLLSLGQTVHCSVKHRWQLASEATIQVAGLADIAQATSNSQQLESLTSRDIWVSRGHGLRLSIQLLLDGERIARAPGAAELVESLGVSLRDGELWSQLGILPTLSLPVISGSTHLDQHGDIILSLAHISPSETAPSPSRGRKCRPADIRAAQPPDGVPTVGLERINMTLNLSRYCWTPNVKALHTSERSSLCNYPATNEYSSDLQQGRYTPPMDSHETPSSNDVDMDRWSISQPPGTADDEMLDTFSSGISDRLIVSHAEKDGTSTFQGQDYWMGLTADNNVGLKPHRTLADIELYQILELTDAALRTLIFVDPVRRSAGIRLIAAFPGPKLAQISPALFSTGYLTAVSQRTPFVSTIAYTMSALPRRVLSSDLRTKLEKLASLPPSPLIAANDNSEQETLCNDKVRKVIKARIWRMMQKTLYNPGAARRLKPIKANGDVIQSRNPDEMLDDSSMPSLQADFDPLLDNGELYDPFRTEEYSSHGDIEILENNDLQFDVLMSAGGPEIIESGDEELLHQEDEETSSNPKDTHTPDSNAPRIPFRLYANNDSTGTLPSSRAVDHPTINDDEGIHSRADGVSLTNKQGAHSSLRHSPPSGTRSITPNDNPSFTYESVLGSQRSNDDEDILYSSECTMELEKNHFSLSHTPSLPNDNVLFPHEDLLQIERSDDNEDLLFRDELRFSTAKDGREVNDYDNETGDEDHMIDI